MKTKRYLAILYIEYNKNNLLAIFLNSIKISYKNATLQKSISFCFDYTCKCTIV